MSLNDKFKIKLASPTVNDFLTLRSKVGWQAISIDDAKTSLANSLFHVVIYNESQPVGMGRVVGDGVMYFYIQDIAVDPTFQGCGIGAAVMEQIEKYLSNTAIKGSTIGLLAVKGKEAFYARYGYLNRPDAELGHGMCKFV